MDQTGGASDTEICILDVERRDNFSVIESAARKLLSRLEAAIRIEPMNKGFAEI